MTARLNVAIGGRGGIGASGGEALGGGLFNGRANPLVPSDASDLAMEGGIIGSNQAVGGAGGAGGNGGQAHGAGVFNGAGAAATFRRVNFTINQATGGVAGAGGVAGQGIGGGLYTVGLAFADFRTSVRNNRASTANNDIFGDLIGIP